jgi:peptide/nickel transport system permease protein
MIPGDVVDIMYEEMEYAKDMEEMREILGLDKPIYVQYFSWMGNILKGDWGKSLWSNEPVLEEIGKRWPVTLELAIMALLISLLMGIPIGTYSAIRQDTAGDYILRSYAIFLLSTPGYMIAILIVLVPTLWFEWWVAAPAYVHFLDNPLVSIKNNILPAFCLGGAMSGSTMRMMRTMMLEVLRQDYIRTAWAKGLSERVIIPRHAMKNALIPVITIIGIQMIFLIGGSVIIETIFRMPGLGRHFVYSITQRDYTVVSGINLCMASVVVFMNLLVDICYAYLDPRIRYR